jgi:cytosine/adenosine deaminase-related metal-dependent hydrolase
MKFISLLSVFATLFTTSVIAKNPLSIVGLVPGEYLGKTASKTYLANIVIDDRYIQSIDAISESSIAALKKASESKKVPFLILKNKATSKFDIIYPGLIDLHGHNKQNVLPTWDAAKGQFGNRFEWRKKVKNYGQVQSNNMNPWSAHPEAKVAAYRWSEMQAMVLGSTYLQGHIMNDKQFAIHSVEDSKAYITERKAISSAGDIISPATTAFLWNQLKPVITELGCIGQDKCYGKAVVKYLNTKCTSLNSVATKDIYSLESYKWLLANKDELDSKCKVDDKKRFLAYFTKVFGINQHSEFIKRYNYLKDPKRGAIVTHMAEGRKNDPYNWTEFQTLRLTGLAIPGMSFIHGVGLDSDDFKYMAKQDMGIVWSPYSNFLLYGETFDIAAAKRSGVTMALGSDWTPTGSKGVLDELKLARKYVRKNRLARLFTDRELYYMVTKYPAKIINHYGYESDKERGVGTIEKGAMGTLIVVQKKVENPYTNLVLHARAQEVNMVIMEGVPVYGNISYLQAYGQRPIEVISGKLFSATLKKNAKLFPPPGSSSEEIGNKAFKMPIANSNKCKFLEEKGITLNTTYDSIKKTIPFKTKTKLDLDTFNGVVKYLGTALLSQSKNAIGKGNKDFAVKTMTPLYGCEDSWYTERLTDMVKINGTDEYDQNTEDRIELRLAMGLYSDGVKKTTLPKFFAELFQLPYSITLGYSEKAGRDVEVDVNINRETRSYDLIEKELKK